MKDKRKQYYVGVDVGGTKIMAALVKGAGKVIGRARAKTLRNATPKQVFAEVIWLIRALLADKKVKKGALRAIGIGVPGIVDPDEGRIVVTPNMNLSGFDAVGLLKKAFGVPVALGNDTNLGTMGESWLGAARFAQSAVGIFVGTGIGAGVLVDGKLFRGSRESAGEIGHIVMQIKGPLCGCGNRGCLEAMASRTAIERDIRQAVAAGQKTILTQTVGKGLRVIRSRMLRNALQQGDPLVRDVVRRASEVLGYACLTVRHLLDPDAIIIGGGVIEACGDFMMPVIEEIVAADALPGARSGGIIVQSALGDDAVAIGAVALAQEVMGEKPLGKVRLRLPRYPRVSGAKMGEISVNDELFKGDIFIRADGRIKERDKSKAYKAYGSSHDIGREELDSVCGGSPDILIVGTGHKGQAAVTAEGEAFLRRRNIALESLPTQLAVRRYNRAEGRKAFLVHVTC
jgi:glucokinase